jgi:hypothetical protein
MTALVRMMKKIHSDLPERAAALKRRTPDIAKTQQKRRVVARGRSGTPLAK